MYNLTVVYYGILHLDIIRFIKNIPLFDLVKTFYGVIQTSQIQYVKYLVHCAAFSYSGHFVIQQISISLTILLIAVEWS